MSEKIGPLTFGKKEEHIFLGKEISQPRDYSEQTAIDIDDEIKKIVIAAQDKARDLLAENIDKLHKLANALLEKECLTGDEIDDVLKKLDETEAVTEEKD